MFEFFFRDVLSAAESFEILFCFNLLHFRYLKEEDISPSLHFTLIMQKIYAAAPGLYYAHNEINNNAIRTC